MNSSIDQPEISVVVCAYTEKRCDDLVVAITSLQQQTLVPHEVILVIDHNRALLEWAQEKFASIRPIWPGSRHREPRGARFIWRA